MIDEIDRINQLKQAEQTEHAAPPATPDKKAARKAARRLHKAQRRARARTLLGIALVTIGLLALLLPLWSAALPTLDPTRLLDFWWLIFLVKPLLYGLNRSGRCVSGKA